MRGFWSKARHNAVKFVYLTRDLDQLDGVRRMAGEGLELSAAVTSLDAARDAVARSGARVVLTDAHLDGATWRDVLSAMRFVRPAPAVVVILDSFEGTEWADIIRLRAYDVLLRPLRSESLVTVLSGAYQYAHAQAGAD